MQRSIKIDAINSYLVCTLCKGYLIDATTLVECLHSFCRSCLLKYLESSYNCPKCSMEIHKTKPFDYIRSDPCLQEIVYKLVPDLFSNEEKRKRAWKKQETKSDEAGSSGIQQEPADDSRILVTLKYFRGTSRMERIKTEKVLQMFPTRYLCCNPEMPVQVLKKFVCLKYDISLELFDVELWRGDETLCEELTLKQLIQIYGLFRERKPLDLHFSLYPKFEPTSSKESVGDVKSDVPKHSVSNVSEENDISDIIKEETIKEETASTSHHKDEPSPRDGSPTSQQEEEGATNSGNKLNQSSEQLGKREEVSEKADTSRLDGEKAGTSRGDNEKAETSRLDNEKADTSRLDDEKADISRLDDEKGGALRLDENLLLKEELKKLTSSKNNLNTTDSDSSQKSNVSSLDVNLLMDEDFKPEMLQNEFLNLFDSDSQHNSDIDISGFDVNLSIDSNIENISKTMGTDILNLFDNDLNNEPCVSNLPKDAPNNITMETNTSNNNETELMSPNAPINGNNKLTVDNNDGKDDSRLFIPTRTVSVAGEGMKEDIPESPLISDTSMPKLPEVSNASNMHFDNTDGIPVGKPKFDRICLSSTPTTCKNIGNSEVPAAAFSITPTTCKNTGNSEVPTAAFSITPTTCKNTGNSEVPASAFMLTTGKDSVESGTISTNNFDMSKLQTGLNTDTLIDPDIVPNKNNIEKSHVNGTPKSCVSPIEPSSNLVGNCEAILDNSDLIIKLLESDTQNDSDVNSSAENEIMDISASLENDVQNLVHSERCINVPVGAPISPFSTPKISTPQPNNHSEKCDTFVNGSAPDAIPVSKIEFDKGGGHAPAHTSTSEYSNITSSKLSHSPDVISPRRENEPTNTVLNTNNTIVHCDPPTDDVLKNISGTVFSVDTNTTSHPVGENSSNLDDNMTNEKRLASLVDCTVNICNLTNLDNYQASSSSQPGHVNGSNGLHSLTVNSTPIKAPLCINAVVGAHNFVHTLLPVTIDEHNGNLLSDCEQPMDQT